MHKNRSLVLAGFAGLSVLLGSSSCSSTFDPKTCATDGDCGADLVCVARDNKQKLCMNGDDAPLRIGMSAAASGPSQDLGLEMRRGVQLAFDAQNGAGGIRKRKLELVFRDDQYTPAVAEQNARQLVDAVVGSGPPRCPTTQTPPTAGQDPFSQTELLPGPNAVSAVIGNVGTPTMMRAAPIIVETGTLFFGAFSGAAAMLRDTKAGPCAKYIFNLRASYGQEARATLEFFFAQKVPDDRHIISFDQNDTFGDAGYVGLVTAYQTMRDTPPAFPRFRYSRDDAASVPAQSAAAIGYIKSLLAADAGPHVVGIMMTDTYGPGAQFIQALKNWQYASDNEQASLRKADRLTMLFSNVSFVGANSLAARLHDIGNVATPNGAKPYTENVFVSQVVPNYEVDSSDAVLDYKRLLLPTGASPTFTSLEGYLAARVFLEGLKNNKGAFTADNLVVSLENLPPLNLGLGASAGFTKENHQFSKSVYGTAITPDGRFQNQYFWSDGTKIQLFE
jgi:ABC-type branched-subunit amino acid transport system substrate-binding protein